MAKPVTWPPLEDLVMPRGDAAMLRREELPAVDPVLDALSFAARPWDLRMVWHALRETGSAIPNRIEAEMAAALHFLVGHALRSGADWRAAAIADLDGRSEARTANAGKVEGAVA